MSVEIQRTCHGNPQNEHLRPVAREPLPLSFSFCLLPSAHHSLANVGSPMYDNLG